jgi:hypothetical protein
VGEHRQVYKGRSIIVRQRDSEAIPEPAAVEAAEPELLIDDEPVPTVRDASGMYLASGYAYDPQESLVDLGKRIVDYREAVQQEGGEHGRPQAPCDPDTG